jgi:hypothetical protein
VQLDLGSPAGATTVNLAASYGWTSSPSSCGMTWTADDAVVWCYGEATANAFPAPFVTLSLENGRPGKRIAYTTWRHNLAARKNSTGGSITSTWMSEGRYEIRFAGLLKKGATETVQVSRHDSNGYGWCQLESWSTVGADVVIRVACRSYLAAYRNSDFAVLFIE